ncbi:MAG: hypothetical protein JW850_18760 [Thermoflexales bacterium]|nr:hypothetical protein [Thermoflexales bacterium]
MDFSFELATQQDDLAIRRLLAASPMPGSLTVTFEREPDYFLGCGTMGGLCQVVLMRHLPDGEIAGMACRGSQARFVNDQVEDVGYIGQIRIADKYQGLWLLARGMPFFRQLHAAAPVSAYLGAISDENRVARGVMVDHPRRQFPDAAELARMCTLGIILQRPKAPLVSDCQLDRGSPQELEEIVAYLRRHGAARQFFPAYTLDDFDGGPLTRGFDVRDFIVARRRGGIVGVIGLWDQSAYKQTVVQSYSGVLRWLRPAYNIGARILGVQGLPAPGEHIHSAYASFICVADDDPAVFRALLRGVYNLAAERRYAHLMLGLAERDPLLPVARQYPHIAYYSRLYLAYWKDEVGDFCGRLDGRVPYIEIAAL